MVNFLYNQANELNQNTQWYETFFRGYDPALGRFLQVDPLSFSEQATYQYAGNNPVMFNDPLGDKAYHSTPWELKAERDATLAYLNLLSSAWAEAGGGGFHSPSGGNSTNWADGITQADWTLWGGSDTYREATAAGAMDLGGFLYFYDDKTSELNPLVVENGRIGYLKEENSVRRIEEEINGVTYTGVEVTSRLVMATLGNFQIRYEKEHSEFVDKFTETTIRDLNKELSITTVKTVVIDFTDPKRPTESGVLKTTLTTPSLDTHSYTSTFQIDNNFSLFIYKSLLEWKRDSSLWSKYIDFVTTPGKTRAWYEPMPPTTLKYSVTPHERH